MGNQIRPKIGGQGEVNLGMYLPGMARGGPVPRKAPKYGPYSNDYGSYSDDYGTYSNDYGKYSNKYSNDYGKYSNDYGVYAEMPLGGPVSTGYARGGPVDIRPNKASTRTYGKGK